ncbi:TadE/TadG family type IV pilus assembly protein [Candidatus Methylobacter oryzae]|uniref:Pilus assembly protein n=1 Tax=Candidatus Methylobacter oryzae TaxID=2497749 RepID=A0ABY3C5W3_9GAMM|nr:TadE family protein [Candidatus Methylobacter oryzae]TRW89690.1 pilus assembly protein [Candidatus Methylobacter oryzae]
MRNQQKGLYIVEFALVASLFFVLLFGVIEFARALFVWNTLTEATRRGARLAVVCPVDHASIANVTVFNAPGSAGASPIVPGLNSSNVVTEYLDQTGAVTAIFNDIRYARVRIVGFQHTLLIPALLPGLPSMQLTAPQFETILPRESLGAVPDGAGSTQCP